MHATSSFYGFMYILTVFYPSTIFCHFLSIHGLYERSLLSLRPTLAALWRREVTYDNCQIKYGPGVNVDFPDAEFSQNMLRSLDNEIVNCGGGGYCVLRSPMERPVSCCLLWFQRTSRPGRGGGDRPSKVGTGHSLYGAQRSVTCAHFPPFPLTDLG